MHCYNGIEVKDQGIVPCGQCMACRINTGRQWTARILMEQYATPWRSYFQTFTYNETTLPLAQNTDHVATLRKKPFLKWVDNQKAEIGPFRYYAVGEYGANTRRPHYHMAVFPTNDSQVALLRYAWRKRFGFTDEIELTDGLSRYLASYAAKKLTSWDDPRLEENQEPEFRASSRRPPLGSDITAEIGNRYRDGKLRAIVEERGDVERTIRLGRHVYSLPRWSLQKIREAAGVPQRHRDRILANPKYLEYHELEEATQCQNSHFHQETRINAETTQKARRNPNRL